MTTTPGLATRAVFRPGRLVGTLAVTQTVGYGVLYYAFSVILGPMSDDLEISHTTAAGALTLAVLVSGLLSIPVGRWLDARGGHALMTVGSVVGTVAVFGWSQVHSAVQLCLVFVLIGVASAMVLYEPAFAVVVAATEPARRAKALLGVTLVAGFASSIFIPLTGQLVDRIDWRRALVVLAVLLAALTVPLHALGLRRTAAARHQARRPRTSPTWVLHDPGFWLLAATFVLHGAALAVIAVHLVQYLTSLGHPAVVAATLAGLLGLLSVTGRVVTTLSTRWLPMATIVGCILVGQGIAMSLLPVVGRQLLGAIACLVLFGLGFGVASIATPAILLDRYGAIGYGTIAGTLAAPILIAKATAPLGGALLAAAVGYRTLVLLVAAACVVAGVLLFVVRRMPTEDLSPV
ncbi:MFS transporter [Kribbella sp. VKM Ac-2566]|uniref:MFS transporter n=1 Tax=Kribbella sp. VKM Ac-2566 TaxID=2512218 RepID=UPI001063AA75|nr:MFS transporter [Kribbella sp. VKM Ac-2566]TDW98271.1 putative MFS family arabinose efflux permease [Kribbella sp. VKM Ac-2566]